MSHFFFSPQESKSVAIACAPEGTPPSYALIDELSNSNKMPFELILKKVTFAKGRELESTDLSSLKHIWFDYQPNSLAWPIMSERMKDLIESCATGCEYIDWISVDIQQDANNIRTYYILRFNKEHDVLDQEKTLFINKTGAIIKPVYDSKKVARLCVFYKPSPFWQITSGIYVSKEIKAVCEAKGLIGLNFEDVRMN